MDNLRHEKITKDANHRQSKHWFAAACQEVGNDLQRCREFSLAELVNLKILD